MDLDVDSSPGCLLASHWIRGWSEVLFSVKISSKLPQVVGRFIALKSGPAILNKTEDADSSMARVLSGCAVRAVFHSWQNGYKKSSITINYTWQDKQIQNLMLLLKAETCLSRPHVKENVHKCYSNAVSWQSQNIIYWLNRFQWCSFTFFPPACVHRLK